MRLPNIEQVTVPPRHEILHAVTPSRPRILQVSEQRQPQLQLQSPPRHAAVGIKGDILLPSINTNPRIANVNKLNITRKARRPVKYDAITKYAYLASRPRPRQGACRTKQNYHQIVVHPLTYGNDHDTHYVRSHSFDPPKSLI